MRQSTIFTVLSVLFFSVLVAATSTGQYAGEGEAINPYPGSCHYGGKDMLRVPKSSGYRCFEKILVEAQTTTGEVAQIGTVGDICTSCGLNNIGIAIELFKKLNGNVGQLLKVILRAEK